MGDAMVSENLYMGLFIHNKMRSFQGDISYETFHTSSKEHYQS